MAARVPTNGARILVCDGEPQTLRAVKAILRDAGFAVAEEAEKVRAFEAGADDYLTKPFGPDELVARLRALLRRAARGRTEPKIVIDELELDLAARTVAVAGEDVHLTPTEFALLRTLVRNRGALMTHSDLPHDRSESRLPLRR